MGKKPPILEFMFKSKQQRIMMNYTLDDVAKCGV